MATSNDFLSVEDEVQDGLSDLDQDAFPEEEYSSLKRSLSRIKNSPPAYFHNAINQSRSRTPSTEGLHINLPRLPMASEVALAGLQYLPTPLVVLSSLKTIILANEAMGRLLGLGVYADAEDSDEPVSDVLKGRTLSQIGIDMLSDGVPVWVSWEKFLDTLTADADDEESGYSSGEMTPVATPTHLEATPATKTPGRDHSPKRGAKTIRDTVVDVLVSTQKITARSGRTKSSSGSQSTCKMIISIWSLQGQRFYTCTFTSPNVPPPSRARAGNHSHPMVRAKSSTSTRSSRSSHSQTHTPNSSTSNSTVQSPSEGDSANSSMFLPGGVPARCANSNTITDFQKITRMKDAMLKAMDIPVLAMWKDESVVFPNPSMRRLLAVHADPTSDESYDFISRFNPWTSDFSRRLEDEENPIVSLCRTQQPFHKWQIGLVNDKTGKKSTYDVDGYPVLDDNGEFFAGLIAFKDVTEYTEMIATTVAESEQQFALICNMVSPLAASRTPLVSSFCVRC